MVLLFSFKARAEQLILCNIECIRRRVTIGDRSILSSEFKLRYRRSPV
jgi:hypothetical protein